MNSAKLFYHKIKIRKSDMLCFETEMEVNIMKKIKKLFKSLHLNG